MPSPTYAVTQKKWELRSKALAANLADLPHLEAHLVRLDALKSEVQDLTAKQASLAASKQEVSKLLAALINEGQKLLTFLDVGIRQHYGNRSEKLVEFGLQPFRPQPRIRIVGPDGQPLKRSSETPETPDPTHQ
jgi:hypothetical protein